MRGLVGPPPGPPTGGWFLLIACSQIAITTGASSFLHGRSVQAGDDRRSADLWLVLAYIPCAVDIMEEIVVSDGEGEGDGKKQQGKKKGRKRKDKA